MRVLNLSVAVASPSPNKEHKLEEALSYAARRGAIVVAAAGNRRTIGSSAITRHIWVVPVAGCDLRGRPSGPSNFSASIVRRIVDVILSFTNRQTDVTEKYFVRVDVTEEFPFLVTKMSPYYDR